MEIKHEQNQMKMFADVKHWDRGEHDFHWHEKIEIVRCLNKSFFILTDGVNHTLNPGDICVIGGQTIHKFTLPEDETDILILQFPYEILLKSDTEIQSVQPLIREEELKQYPDLCETLDAVFSVLLREGNAVMDNKDAFLNHMYAGLYCLLMRKFPILDESAGKRAHKSKKDFYSIVSYVNEHFRENINVQSIANTLFMDRGRLSGLFLKYAGISLNHYIHSLRLAQVKRLTEEGMTVTQAALESGFQSLRTYNNVKKNIQTEI